ncbi:carbamoyltransferase C-terminal domain-containing protein [Streptomyces sp. SAS_270]|uniref:carbamoyltransferase C-terminal domain-containing protein n=1 Tax=Streptomyces sp. SAS_270 TaxID=3412748 RepID=UPI00403CA175
MTAHPRDAGPADDGIHPWHRLGRESTFGERLGAGVRVLVVGDGSARAEPGAPADEHTERVATLVGQIAGRPDIGYASADALKAARLAGNLREMTAGYDIVALPWSAPEADADRLGVRRAFEEVAREPDAPVFIAAAGHDGPGRLRFPASCTSVIAVGVTGDDGAPTPYCGSDQLGRKPQLLIPDAPYLAWSTAHGVRPMRGTSAAVGIAAGLAAALLGALRAQYGRVASPMLRAALLASTAAGGRLLEAPLLDHLDDTSPDRLAVLPAGPGRLCLDLSTSPRTIRVAAVAAAEPETAVGATAPWLPPAATLRIDAGAAGTTGAGWAVCDAPASESPAPTVGVDCPSGATMYVAVSGAEATPAALPQEGAPQTPGRRGPVVLGLSASHDASACLFQDGRAEVAVQQERVTRRKHDGVGYLSSRAAADYCLSSAGIAADDVDVFAFNAQPLLPGYTGLCVPSAADGFDLFDPYDERVVYVSHHLAHAFSAFWGSPFDEAVVVVCDGSGGSVLGADDLLISGPELKEYLAQERQGRLPQVHVFSVYHFHQDGYRLLFRESADSFNVRVGSSSLGETYAAVSQYVFGDWQEGSGKLMGLAPWGNADAAGPSLLEPGPDGLPRFRGDWKDHYRAPGSGKDPMACADLAARIQADLEQALVERMRHAMKLLPDCPNLAYAGGVALNSVANDRIARQSGADHFFVLPASSDAGVSLGAAAAAHFRVTGSTRRPLGEFNDYLGHPYTSEDHAAAINLFGDRVTTEDLDLEELAGRIAAGDVVGWFQDGSEFGPRALGNRSVLADARKRSTWDFINSHIKFREDFRPLAPMVPEEVAAEYFDLDAPAPHMLRVVPVREQYRDRLAAVTHVDGTARVQTVSRDANPRIHRLLHLVGERTGFPIMVNTSLNRRGEPMIETPRQALDMLLGTHLAAMVLGDRLVRRLDGSDAPLTVDSCIALGPDVRLVQEHDAHGSSLRITGGAEGKSGVRLPSWCFTALTRAAPGRPLSAYLPGCVEDGGPTLDDALAFLTALRARCLLVLTREAPRARPNPGQGGDRG